MAATKIAVYSISDLKNTTDDALPNYLTSLKFKQSHFLTDVRLALGYSAVVIAAITFYADYKLGWDKTKYWTFWAVLVYFTLNGALTFWIWGVEKGKVFAGQIDHPKVGRKSPLSIASSVAKHTPIYNITVEYSNSKGETKTLKLSSPFTRWFDVNGFFVAKPFQQWLALEIPLIGQVDPKNKDDDAKSAASANGESEVDGPVENEKYDTPKKSTSSDAAPTSTRSRRGKRG
ncbi:hypothetical protein HO173_005316 [Letharia columbiana]|uniref:Signal peptidase complex subunit 2 n=1 Tax=Letharia columbiana TaxID=112416 RepID=A0A8H6FXG4_9LECA|nr:uncharacterized protein HO173_005316 [Letharia columbiana]KAF6236535.1 hypothetical protein HO173_005316 [Letharia columbiana]